MASNSRLNERQNLLPVEVSDNKETIQLIWLDGNIDKNSTDTHQTMTMLIELNAGAQFYSDSNRCLDLIRSIKHEQIFLIVSGALVRHVLKEVNHHRPLVSIFIFCANRQHHQSLINDYDKIAGVYTDQKTLLTSIREKIGHVEKQILAFSLFDQKQKSTKDVSKEGASFLWHQMLMFVLKQIPQDDLSKRHMIELCRDFYQNNKQQLAKIERFEKSYTRDQAIAWYTDEGFLYKLLNKALRTEDINLLFTFRFFLIDLSAEIEKDYAQIKDKGVIKLFRGAQIPNDELHKLKANLGQIISTNGFLSTSRNPQVAIGFAKSNQLNKDFADVLFEIDADSSLKSISFADVAKKSVVKGEEEVLFNLNSLFQIHGVSYDKKMKLWKIQLITSDHEHDKVQQYFTLAKRNLEDYSPIIYFGRLLLYELGQVDRAKKYFEMLLQSLPPDHPDIGSVHNNMGAVYDAKDDLTLAMQNFERGYEIRRQRLPSDHPQIAGSLYNIGNIHRRKVNYDRALHYYQKALAIEKRNYQNDHLHKAYSVANIGLVYCDKEEYDAALRHLSDALEMFQRLLPDQHTDIAVCLGQIGWVNEEQCDYDVALDYYQQRLKMNEQCLPSDHPTLSSNLQSVINVYKKMNQIEKGLSFCQEKLVEQKNQLGENHLRVGRTLMIMSEIVGGKDLQTALLYAKEALPILENSMPPDLVATADCLQWIAALYGDNQMLEDALQCCLRALDIQRQALSSDHVDIAWNLYRIGDYLHELNKPFEALRYYNESLSIYRVHYGPEHKSVKDVEDGIARLKIS